MQLCCELRLRPLEYDYYAGDVFALASRPWVPLRVDEDDDDRCCDSIDR